MTQYDFNVAAFMIEVDSGRFKKATILTETPQGGGGGEITGMYAPTNSLLKPEEDPTKNGRMKGDSSVNDEFIDKDRLSLDKAEDLGTLSPGEGRAYQQEDGKGRNGKIVPPGEVEGEQDTPRAIEDEEFDPKDSKVAKAIKKGTLFKRDSSGKPVIKGIHTPEAKQRLKDNASKVKDILKTT
jgi:hypothetical protein